MTTIQHTETGVRLGAVEFIWARNSTEFLFSNSILVHGDEPVIVDPSANFTYISSLAEAHAVKTVLNTHYHGDHRSLNHLFSGSLYAAPEQDAPAIRDFNEYLRHAVEDVSSFYAEWIRKIFVKHQIGDCPVSQLLQDGDILDTGAEKIHIIHAPGHTPGHSALYFENADCLFTADIDLTPFGPWYAGTASDIALFKKSVEKVRAFQAKFYVPSHGERLYDREQFLEKIDRFYAHFAGREERILGLLKNGPMDLATLCSHGIVYKQASLTDALKCYFQLHMVKKHLQDLVLRGLIVRLDGERYEALSP